MDEELAKYHGIISENIKKFRKTANLSQETIADKLGCSREFISRVENCKERVSLNTLIKIADMFNVSPSIFFIQP